MSQTESNSNEFANVSSLSLSLSLGCILKQAWKNTRGMKGVVFAGQLYLLMLLAVVMIVFILLAEFLGSLSPIFKNIIYIIAALCAGGILTSGVAFLNRTALKHFQNKPIGVRCFFRPFAYFSEAVLIYIFNLLALFLTFILFCLIAFIFVFLTNGMIVLATSVNFAEFHTSIGAASGFWLHFFIGLDLVICYLFYSFFTTLLFMLIPIAMDKKISVKSVVGLWLRFCFKNFFKIIWINLISSLILIISLIPVGLGLIWTLPWVYSQNMLIYKALWK